MGSNDAVDVYQANSEKCCARSFVSCVDPAFVTSNLLLNVKNSKTSRIVLAGRFRPWYGECLYYIDPLNSLNLLEACTVC